jgi:hypothetical protein
MLLVLTLCIGCGGGLQSSQKTSTAQTPFQGSWEFVAVSTVDPPPATSVRLIEANLTQAGSQINSTQGAAAYYNSTGSVPPVQPCGGDGCITSITGTANDSSLSFSGTLDKCHATPCSIQGQGVLTGTTISGTWTASGLDVGSSPDAGTFTATVVPKLSGTYAGTLTTCVTHGSIGCTTFGSDNVSAAFSEGSADSLTVTATLSGTDNGAFALTGSTVGNIFLVSGTISGQSVSLSGYYDQTGQYTGVKNSIEVFDSAAGIMWMGLLHGN